MCSIYFRKSNFKYFMMVHCEFKIVVSQGKSITFDITEDFLVLSFECCVIIARKRSCGKIIFTSASVRDVGGVG